ncbi:glycoside hydrolase family 3 N-terminal domain-containing protein [Enterococcus sp.]|uniref:glycoside hydrolase family 3 N-terminal domain-containing protein n=1 Tax=Enterococcus sp. TaxID=35783 RepID=UPI0028B065B4|nr:glycoside hydrolase family 3 N-terminal domain-containing protein [Enterococcus sp.]
MIDALLKQMTLQEKVGQLNQRLYGWQVYEKVNGQIVLTDYFKEEVKRFGSIGWIYGVFRADPWSGRNHTTGLHLEEAKEVSQLIQSYLKANTRLQIPAFLVEESPHGHQALYSTTTPVNFSVGASWNPTLYEEVQKIVAAELREKGAHVGLVSALDVTRDPRWGRTEECFSEDPFLTSCFAKAAVTGLQGDFGTENVIAVLKHLAAQGACMGGHNAGPVSIGDRELREIHLPPMVAGVAAGAAGFMAAYNDLDGVPCHTNKYLLQSILREEQQFKGIVMADGCALDRLTDRLPPVEAAALALSRGIDVSLWDNVYPLLEEAVDQGLVTMDVLDQAVRRVLSLKEKLGLFAHAVSTSTSAKTDKKTSVLQLAAESIVLLKNQQQVLPIPKDRPQKIALIGPHIKNIYHLLGDYTPFKSAAECVTICQGMERYQTESLTIKAAEGCGITQGNAQWLQEAMAIAKSSDTIIVTMGGSSIRDFGTVFDDNGAARQGSHDMTSGENIDLAHLNIPTCQLALIKALATLGKPMIGLMISGRPHLIEPIESYFTSILYCGYPGQYGGEAISRLIFGDDTPSGHLAVSIPSTEGQLPVYYNYRKQAFQEDYLDESGRPKYSFGYGLTYGAVASVITSVRLFDGCIEIEGETENPSAMNGSTTIQVYLKDYTTDVIPRVKALCGFTKSMIPAQGSKTFSLRIPLSSLLQGSLLTETPEFTLQVEAENTIIFCEKFNVTTA